MATGSPQCYINQFAVDLPEGNGHNGAPETESRPLPARLAAMSLDEMKDFSTRYFNQTTEGWSTMGYVGRALNPFVLFKIMYSYFIEGSWPRAKESSAAWHKLSEEEKQPYMICARHIKKLHKEKYPNYKYKPVHGKHKSRAGSKCTPDADNDGEYKPSKPGRSGSKPKYHRRRGNPPIVIEGYERPSLQKFKSSEQRRGNGTITSSGETNNASSAPSSGALDSILESYPLPTPITDYEYLIPELSLDAMTYPLQSPMSDCFTFSELSGSDHGSYYVDYSRSASPAFSETPNAEYASRGPSNATFASSLSPTQSSFSPFVSSDELPVLEEFEFPGYDGGNFLSVPPMGGRRYSFTSPASTASNFSELLNTPADVMSTTLMSHPETMANYATENSGYMYAPNPEDSWNKVDTLGLFHHNQGLLDGTSVVVGSGVSSKQAWDYMDKLVFSEEFVDGHAAATATRTSDIPSDHPSTHTMEIENASSH